MVVKCWNRQFGCDIIHPTQKFASRNLLQMSCLITWAWSFLTVFDGLNRISLIQKTKRILNFLTISNKNDHCAPAVFLLTAFRDTIAVNRLLSQWSWVIQDRSKEIQPPRIDLNKRFLPRPNTTTAWKFIPYRSIISKKQNSPMALFGLYYKTKRTRVFFSNICSQLLP